MKESKSNRSLNQTKNSISAWRERIGSGRNKETMAPELFPVVCKNCVLFLIKQCYGKHWWFRLVREPLVWGMRILAWWNGLMPGAMRYVTPNVMAVSAS